MAWNTTDYQGTNPPATIRPGTTYVFPIGGLIGGLVGLGFMIFGIISWVRYKKRARMNTERADTVNGQQNTCFKGQQFQVGPTTNPNGNQPALSAQTTKTSNEEDKQPVPAPVTGPNYSLPRDHLEPLAAPPSYVQVYGSGS